MLSAYVKSFQDQDMYELLSWNSFVVLSLIFIGSQYERPATKLSGLRRKLRTILSFFLFITTITGVNVILFFTCWFVHQISPRLRRDLNSRYAQTFYLKGVSFIFPSTRIVFSGDKVLDDTSPALVIANHQVDADWVYIWSFLKSCGQASYAKFIMKSDMEHLPLIGWGMKGLNFISLKRDWSKDKENLARQLRTFVEDRAPLRLVIFPEGTTINKTSMEKCAKYAEKENRPTFKHLLLPRVTGFNACVDSLKAVEGCCVYDLTVAYESYSGEIPTWDMGYDRKVDQSIPNMSKLFAGDNGFKAHIHVKRYTMKEISAAGDFWLDSVWERKDQLLSEFIKTGQFAGEQVEVDIPPDEYVYFLIFALPVMFWYFLRLTLFPLVDMAISFIF